MSIDVIVAEADPRLKHALASIGSVHYDPTKHNHTKPRNSLYAPFIAWDGEGITYGEHEPQQYVLFGNSAGFTLEAQSLTTADCLDLICRTKRAQPKGIHVGFAFKYDSEMILSDLSVRHWYVLRKAQSVNYQRWKIVYHPGRLLRVKDKEQGTSCTIYDVFGFFQTSFIVSLRKWLPDSELASIDIIETGKAARGIFRYDQLQSLIKPYWKLELELLVKLMNQVRDDMARVDLVPKQWYGVGAIASILLDRHRIRPHMARHIPEEHNEIARNQAKLPAEVNEAARYAYAGGRFEQFQLGHYEGTVYQYDINSAYPDAMRTLPSLKNGWRKVGPTQPKGFGVWRIRWESPFTNPYWPGPAFIRDKTGRVYFPMNVDSWYWTPEAQILSQYGGQVLEGWVLNHNGQYPFSWISDLYEERRERKRNGDPSEKVLKLGLNSLYGKTAQRIGHKWNRLPAYHQLEWAGWITSATRAKLWHAMIMAGESLIAVETDSLFTTKPLQLPISEQLGEWSLETHEWITYLQSGVRWTNNGSSYRGFDKDSLTHDKAMDWLSHGNPEIPIIGQTTRFIGSGRGLGTPLHRQWITETRELHPGVEGKRRHISEFCGPCNYRQSMASSLHPMICPHPGGRSSPHSLPWINDGAPGLEWQEMEEIERWLQNE